MEEARWELEDPVGFCGPAVLQEAEVRKRGVAIEVCPISYWALEITGNQFGMVWLAWTSEIKGATYLRLACCAALKNSESMCTVSLVPSYYA